MGKFRLQPQVWLLLIIVVSVNVYYFSGAHENKIGKYFGKLDGVYGNRQRPETVADALPIYKELVKPEIILLDAIETPATPKIGLFENGWPEYLPRKRWVLRMYHSPLGSKCRGDYLNLRLAMYHYVYDKKVWQLKDVLLLGDVHFGLNDGENVWDLGTISLVLVHNHYTDCGYNSFDFEIK